MIHIKNITVLGQSGEIFEPTYLTRAHGLVRQGRATWLNSETIRLNEIKEKFSMNENIIKQDAVCEEDIRTNAMPIQTVSEAAQSVEPIRSKAQDPALLEQAERRVKEKRRLWWQLLDLVTIIVALWFMVASTWSQDRALVAVVLGLFWGIRLLVRVIKFTKPNFSGGFKNYVKTRQENALEVEYNRLKKIHNVD